MLTARSLEEIDGESNSKQEILGEGKKINGDLNGKKHVPVNHRKESS